MFAMSSRGEGSSGGHQGGLKKNWSVRPMKIAQVMKCTQSGDGGWSYEGAEVDHITIVTLILNVATSKTNTRYDIDDGTGTFEVRCWEEYCDGLTQREMTGLAYIRVTGQLKVLGSKRYLATRMPLLPVEDYHEVVYHDLECVFWYLYQVNGPPPGQGSLAQLQDHVQARSPSLDKTTEYESKWSGLSSLQLAILRYIKRGQGRGGMTVKEIVANAFIGPDGLPTALTDEVSNALESLLKEELIHTTVDECTFALK